MAVQAQYPPNALFLNRTEPERNADMDFPKAPPPVFFANGVNGNPRKRVREPGSTIPMAAAPPNQSNNPISLFSTCPTAPSMLPSSSSFVSLAQLQAQAQAQAPPLVSTGLRLSCDDQQQQQQNQAGHPLVSSPSCSSTLLSDDLALAAQIGRQRDEIDQFLLAQGEQLRRTLAERRRAHYRTLMGAAEESAARRLREKEAEVERAAKRSSDLEDRLARLRAESMAWQAKAMADQAAAASLHAQLQQAAAAAAHGKAAEECGGESAPADDAESAHVDPERVEVARPGRACRACRTRPVSVVLLPCRHLCLCSACDAAESACPVCRCVRTGSVQVFLS